MLAAKQKIKIILSRKSRAVIIRQEQSEFGAPQYTYYRLTLKSDGSLCESPFYGYVMPFMFARFCAPGRLLRPIYSRMLQDIHDRRYYHGEIFVSDAIKSMGYRKFRYLMQ